ncbi:3-hydroxybutyrate dehydrogenase [Mesocricetibacter intestinalis]|uniref:3-hydroxybutyrate dehydrogenase n=1 Tax=Mesocricetibacter intestinalis TaxID=1521930 RepID=A0A4R6VC54_9PAST|nr:3-hydroxybutyrate dehydrogenase [Mesocricetibacter intestinalis]TDQ59474.1 3-hydroxybutyrate dehydrogenase [Mesocricetibacter intestinalis]
MLNNKTALITGAASGIGLAVSKILAAEGCRICMLDINQEALKVEAEKLQAHYFVADLSRRNQCKEAVDYAAKQNGGVDILVNVAGIQTLAPLEEFPEDKWDFMLNLMLTAPFLLTRYCFPHMKNQGWGRIINLNSIHGLVASEFKAAYVAAKHGLSGLTKVAALEGGAYGITVNSVCPAYVRTPLVDKQISAQAEHHNISERQVIDQIMLQKAAVKRLIEPADIGEFIKFLCSDAAASVSGACLSIDGAWTAA